MPFRSEQNPHWKGASRVPAFVPWPGHFPAGVTLNGIVPHEDWLPTFATAAGAPDIQERLHNGKTDQSPRSEFWQVKDDGQIVAARYEGWKVVFLGNRGQVFGVV